MRAFGIDPGSRITGYGIVEKHKSNLIHIDNGVIKPKANLIFAHRLYSIYKEIILLIDKFKPDVIALEDIFVAKNIKSAMKLGHVRGIAMLAATTANIEIAEYTPSQVKSAIVGIGNATKQQVQIMIKHHLKLPEVAAEDASDALAVAICHLHSFKMQCMINANKN